MLFSKPTLQPLFDTKVLAPPACHAPFTPAPQYKERFKEIKAPRTPAFDRDQVGEEEI